MADRFGVLTTDPPDSEGRRLLLVHDGRAERIEQDLTDEQIKARFDLDRITRAAKIPFCEGLLLDGPLAGTRGYAINELGNRGIFYLPGTPATEPSGPGLAYEVVKLSIDGEPAELRYVTEPTCAG